MATFFGAMQLGRMVTGAAADQSASGFREAREVGDQLLESRSIRDESSSIPVQGPKRVRQRFCVGVSKGDSSLKPGVGCEVPKSSLDCKLSLLLTVKGIHFGKSV